MLQTWLSRLARRHASGPADSEAADRLIAEGNRAEKDGRLEDARRLYRQGLAAAPGYAAAHLNLGIVLEALGDAESAIRSYETALACDSGNPFASYNLGKLLHTRGSTADAERHLRAALERKPDFPDAHVVLADVLEARGDDAGAAAELDRALELQPNRGDLWLYRGVVLNKLQRVPEAEAALRRAIALSPGLSEAYRILASVLVNQLRIEEGLEVYKAGRAYDPQGYVRASELFALNLSDAISTEALFARHREFGEEVEKMLAPVVARFANGSAPERRLRIGYVSGDFDNHPVALFMIPLLERHDRSACEILCYSLSDSADRVTQEIVERTDVWRSVPYTPRAELAELIHRDAVDVLVDLSGHSGIPAFDLFAYRPAPVQASWLGYLCTTGLTRIDYRITDAYSDPPGTADRLHTEVLVRLPHVQWCYRPFVSIEPSGAPPCERHGFFTFGSFNQTAKLSRSVRKLWAEILRQLPGSRLAVLGTPPGAARDLVLRDFTADGVEPDRVTIEPRIPRDDYFRWIDGVDLALDTMPYSGGTTTCDALWMGVPVLTLPGTRPVSRSAGSILTLVGLPDWLASTLEDYVRAAVRWAAYG